MPLRSPHKEVATKVLQRRDRSQRAIFDILPCIKDREPITTECVAGSYVPGAKVKLDDVSKILGLSGKPAGIDGGRVEEMVLAGQIEEVARYCETTW